MQGRKPNSSHFKPGQSGNPRGRPPRPRILTTVLEQALEAGVTIDGQPVDCKTLLARLATQIVTSAKVEFPDGRCLQISAPRLVANPEMGLRPR